MPDASAHTLSDGVIPQQCVGFDLETGQVQRAALLQDGLVAQAAAADGGMERIVGVGQFLQVDGLLGDALDVPPALAHCELAGAPAAAPQFISLGSEDAVVVGAQQVQLPPFVQDVKAGFQAGALGVVAQQATAQAVHGADAHGGEVSGAAGRLGGGVKALLQLVGGLLGEGAHHQIGRADRVLQEQVDGAPDQATGLAGAGAGDDQQRPLQVAHHGALPGVQLRLQTENFR